MNKYPQQNIERQNFAGTKGTLNNKSGLKGALGFF